MGGGGRFSVGLVWCLGLVYMGFYCALVLRRSEVCGSVYLQC